MTPDAFDLARFAPPTGLTVSLRNGRRYRFPGDPDVDDVAVMLRLETAIQDKSGADLAEVLLEGKETLKRLILAADASQDVSDLKIGPEEMLVVFALLVHGSTVAEAVGIAITAHNTGQGEDVDETAEEREERLAAAAEDGDADPLSQSPSSSSGPSSGSDVAASSLRATG